MFKKIKDILGIEGVKVELSCPLEIKRDAAHIEGLIKLSSKTDKTITALTIKLIEKYKRGRNENVLINEYLLSSLDLDVNLELNESNSEELKFKLPISLMLSEMDQFGAKNILTKGLAAFAKKMKGVNSYYRIEVLAKIKESSLDAIAKQPIEII